MSAPQGPPPSQPPASQQPSSPQFPSSQPSASQPYGPPSYAGPAKVARVTEGPEIGLPPGVAIAELGPRVLAWLVDSSVLIVLNILRLIIAAARGQDVPTIVSVIFFVLGLGWFVFVWWGYATKAAGPGAQVAKLQLVGMSDGRPVGWGRYLIRVLIFGLAGVFFPVLIGLLIIMVRHPRRQGWHDLAVGSVVIKARPLAPRPSAPGAQQPAASGDQANQRSEAEPTVGIPASYGAPPSTHGGAPGSGNPPSPYGNPPSPYGGPPSSYGSSPEPGAPHPAPYGSPAPAGPSGPPPSSGPAAHYGPVSRFGSPSSSPAAPNGSASSPASSPVSGPAPSAPPVSGPAVGSPVSGPAVEPVVSRAQEDDAVDAAPPASAPAPGVPAPVAPTDRTPEAPAPAGSWQLELDGRLITVTRLVLLGRNPQRGPGEEDAEIIKVKDEARTVSKTHVAIGVDDRGLFVSDRGSTNGSAVTDPDGVYRLLRADEQVRIDAGWVVAFGAHEVKVGRPD